MRLGRISARHLPRAAPLSQGSSSSTNSTPSPWGFAAPPIRCFSSDRPIQEHDVVLLRQRGNTKAKWRLTPPLRKAAEDGETNTGTGVVGGGKRRGTIKLPYGATVDSAQIIGRRILDTVKDSTGRDVVIYEASLANFITHSERQCTPIYPQDANTIVSMMDLHPEHPGEVDNEHDEPFEVFEAGTGAGSLTLHIARALHAANPPLHPEIRAALPTAKIKFKTRSNDDDPTHSPTVTEEQHQVDTTTASTSATEEPPSSSTTPDLVSVNISNLDIPDHLQPNLSSYMTSRRAILHTLDRKSSHSRSAHSLVRRFRRAIYLPTVDFHVSPSIADYILPRLSSRQDRPFLSRAVLDLPAAEDHAEPVVRALRPAGLLVVFSPSISQIASFHAWSVGTRQPLRLERVAELPTSGSAEQGVHDCEGGRAWNLKTVVPKGSEDGQVVQVMRPRVGDRIAGGGFVAVLRRVREDEKKVIEEEEEEEEEDGEVDSEGARE